MAVVGWDLTGIAGKTGKWLAGVLGKDGFVIDSWNCGHRWIHNNIYENIICIDIYIYVQYMIINSQVLLLLDICWFQNSPSFGYRVASHCHHLACPTEDWAMDVWNSFCPSMDWFCWENLQETIELLIQYPSRLRPWFRSVEGPFPPCYLGKPATSTSIVGEALWAKIL